MRLLVLLLTLLSINCFASHQHRHGFGLKRNKARFAEFISGAHKHHHLATAIIPGSVDLTSKASPPENQGSCGSCWDFAITKGLRSALMLIDKDPGVLAFNTLLNNCVGTVKEYGCDGGDFDAGQNFLNGIGPWLNSQDPYTQSEGRCPSGLATAATGTDWMVVGSGNQPPTFLQLAEAMSNQHVLVVDVAVCGSWEDGTTGIFSNNECGADSINHMINMVGYSCETSVDASGNCVFNAQGQPVNGDGYLILMNNWGTDWANGGYMKTRWGVDAVATNAMYFDVDGSPFPNQAKADVRGFLCGVHHWPWCS
jgi:C1A family cysteine protease